MFRACCMVSWERVGSITARMQCYSCRWTPEGFRGTHTGIRSMVWLYQRVCELITTPSSIEPVKIRPDTLDNLWLHSLARLVPPLDRILSHIIVNVWRKGRFFIDQSGIVPSEGRANPARTILNSLTVLWVPSSACVVFSLENLHIWRCWVLDRSNWHRTKISRIAGLHDCGEWSVDFSPSSIRFASCLGVAFAIWLVVSSVGNDALCVHCTNDHRRGQVHVLVVSPHSVTWRCKR